MNIIEFLSYLNSLDVKISAHDERLHCNAPKGVLTSALQEEIFERKAEILKFLRAANLSTHSIIPPILPVSRDRDIPLSFAQERLWFLAQLDPDSPIYNMHYAFQLTGLLNISGLERSLNEIMQRHEILRTTFLAVDGQPRQFISKDIALKLPIEDLRKLSVAERENEVQQQVTIETQQPFDLSQGPLMRVKLLCLAEEKHILLLTIHHIVFDGWSFNVFFHELTTLYEAFSTGKSSPLPELPIQYADFTLWQRKWLKGKILESQLSYWKQKLRGNLPVLKLPTDHLRPAVQTYNGASQSMSLSKNLTKMLNTLSQQTGVTLFMTLLAAFKILLYRYTGQEDIIVGTPIAGRNRAEIENLIGFFVNTLVLRTDLSGNIDFQQLLSRIREMALEAYTHQDLPFEKLLEQLQPKRDLSRTPLFQVFFNMLNFPDFHIELPGLTVEGLPLSEVWSKFDLTLYISEQNERIHLDLVYNTHLFTQARMIEMLEQLRHLLLQIVEKPEDRITHFSLITTTAQAILPNPTEVLDSTWEGAVQTQFSQQASRVPKHLAIVGPHEVWSYEELNARSNQLANYLIASGIQHQDIIAIYGHRSASLVLAILGILKAGAAFLILDADYPSSRLIEYLRVAKPRGWIQIDEEEVLPDTLGKFVSTLSCCCCLKLPLCSFAKTRNLLNDYSSDEFNLSVAPDDLAYVTFTSGSTGRPKGILGRHGPLSHFLPWLSQRFNLSESDRFSMLSGLSHDPLQRDIFTPLQIGATICIPNIEDIAPVQLSKWMEQQKISIAHLTPTMGQILTETNQRTTLTSLRYTFFLGDVLKKYDVFNLQRIAPQTTVVNFYGTTETQRAVGYLVVPNEGEKTYEKSEVKASLNKTIPLGRGIQDVQLLILNPKQQLCGVGEIGEICVRSPHLAKGYIGNDALTQERFIINPFTKAPMDRLYKTGDMGRYLPDGKVEFTGRIDYQVKIRGFRVELNETEAVLRQHPVVRETVIVDREDHQGNKHLVAYVVPNKEQVPTPSELRYFLKQKLPNYMVPSAFIIIDALPLTPNGKVDRDALPEPAQVRQEPEETFVAPRDKLEFQLTKIWEKVLDIHPIGVRDNFFDLGGHSMLAVRLFSQIEKKTGKNLPLVTLFQSPTVEQLARVLRDKGWSPLWSSLVPIQTGGSKSPFFCVPGPLGHVLCFADFAQHIGADQPFYGLQPKGIRKDEIPYTRIEEIAAHYIKEIRTIQPEGPYFLGGNCFGGLVAYEMAQQLQAQGQKVALLALFEAYASGAVYPLPGFIPFMRRFAQRIKRHINNISQLPTKEKLMYILEEGRNAMKSKIWKIAYRFYLDIGRPMPRNLRSVRDANYHALRDYVPKVYTGIVTLFQASEQFTGFFYKPQMGWGKLAVGGVEIYKVAGNHEGIWKGPNLLILAEKLRDSLDKAQKAENSKIEENSE